MPLSGVGVSTTGGGIVGDGGGLVAVGGGLVAVGGGLVAVGGGVLSSSPLPLPVDGAVGVGVEVAAGIVDSGEGVSVSIGSLVAPSSTGCVCSEESGVPEPVGPELS